MMLLFTTGLLSLVCSQDAPQLKSYNIDASKISVSGVSAGAYMAVQFHVSYSKDIIGVGAVAGGPFWCAQDDEIIATSACMSDPEIIDVDILTAATVEAQNVLSIDPTSNMQNSRVYLFSGLLDTVVNTGVVQKLQDYYAVFVKEEGVMTQYNISAEHSMPTNLYGNECSYLGTPYINNCNYDGAYEILNHIYGDITAGTATTYNPNNLFTFDQQEFFGVILPEVSGMDDIGYIYVPTACQSSSTVCRLHIAFHGCYQSTTFIGTTFANSTEYNNHAEINNIIILYPQTHTTVLNPNGCFDWWGYTGPAYATKDGLQIGGIASMIRRVTNNQFPSSVPTPTTAARFRESKLL